METMLLDDIELRETAKRLYDSYSTVLSESKLISIIQDVLGDFAPALDSKYAARRTINDLVMGYYPNEATIKANFIDRVLFPLSPANISIFELPIGNSRVDMCKVNGHSAAYEIKTDLDTFDRLEGQLSDYFDVFETVYVVTSDKRWQELPSYVPEACGIYSYSQDARDGSYHFKAQRKAIKSTNLDSEKQLAVMPKRDLRHRRRGHVKARHRPGVSCREQPGQNQPAVQGLSQATLRCLLGALLQSQAANLGYRL